MRGSIKNWLLMSLLCICDVIKMAARGENSLAFQYGFCEITDDFVDSLIDIDKELCEVLTREDSDDEQDVIEAISDSDSDQEEEEAFNLNESQSVVKPSASEEEVSSAPSLPDQPLIACKCKCSAKFNKNFLLQQRLYNQSMSKTEVSTFSYNSY